jgi:hypothetical protein
MDEKTPANGLSADEIAALAKERLDLQLAWIDRGTYGQIDHPQDKLCFERILEINELLARPVRLTGSEGSE